MRVIKIKALTGPYAGRVREISQEMNPSDLLADFLRHGWEWEMDYSQATGIEAFRWGRADLGARTVRAMQKGLPVSFMGKVYSDPVKLEDAIVYSGRAVTLGSDNDSGVVITDHDLQQPEPEPLAVHRRALEWIEVHSQELLEGGKAVPSPQKKEAFARAVAALAGGLPLGTVGGPTVREWAAFRAYSPDVWGKRLSFEEAVAFLSRKDGVMFGPLQSLHQQCWEVEHCSDDDPEDVAELTSGS